MARIRFRLRLKWVLISLATSEVRLGLIRLSWSRDSAMAA